MMRVITYAIDPETDLISSRFDEAGAAMLATPVLAYDDMLPENSFTAGLFLESCSLLSLPFGWLSQLIWTKKISKAWKNLHRQFWGMKPLPMTADEQTAFDSLQGKIRIPDGNSVASTQAEDRL